MMMPDTILLLHVEGDPIQQWLIKQRLAEMSEYRFEITVAASEDDALALFPDGGFQLVILDYQLAQGAGVNCLRRIREIDRMVPIITVSGAATDEIAAMLISCGADDYLGKQTLKSKLLQQSVRNVLTRWQAFRTRFAAPAF